MPIVAHGIDLVEIARIERMIHDHGERFTHRCFTAEERIYCDSFFRRRAEHYAARFAAKEAAFKVLGTGLRDGLKWVDVSVAREPSGKPRLVLDGRAVEMAQKLDITEWHLSLTHSDMMAVASVIGWRET